MDISHLRVNNGNDEGGGEEPCQQAVEWCAKYETLQEAWDVCPREDWMTWYAASQEADLGGLVVFCAEKALSAWSAGCPTSDSLRVAIAAFKENCTDRSVVQLVEAAKREAPAGILATAAFATAAVRWAAHAMRAEDLLDGQERAAEVVQYAADALETSACDLIREYWPVPPGDAQ